MPPADAPPDVEYETIHYTITSHGTLRVTKDPRKKKSRKHRRRHGNKRDSNGEEPRNEGIETGLHANMTPAHPHASTATSNTPMPMPQQLKHTTTMHIPELGAAIPSATTTGKQGTYRKPRSGTLFPLLSWDEIWAEERPELPGSSNSYRAEQILHASTAPPAQPSATGNAKKTGRAEEIDSCRKSISAESAPRVLVQLPDPRAETFQGSESSVAGTHRINISREPPICSRGILQNQTTGHGHPIAGSSPGPPVPPPHKIMPLRRQTLGPLLLSVQVEDYDEGSRRNDVEYEISGPKVDKTGKPLYRLQERRPGGNWSKSKDSATLEKLNQMELESHVKNENGTLANQDMTRHTKPIKLGQGSSSRSMGYGIVESSVGDSKFMQGPQLRKTSGSWGLRETTITKDQRTMDTNIHLPHNSLASLQTQSLPKNAPAVSPAWSLPPLQQCSPLDEPMSNNKQKLVSARTTPTQGERRFGGHTPVFNSPGSSLTFDSSSQVTQAYPAWATAAPDNSIRRHPVLQYSDFDQLSSSDEGHFRSYPSVPSFETIAIQSPRARRPLPVSPNTTPGRGVIDTERQRFYHDIEGNAHGATPVVHTDKAKPVNLIIRNNQPHSSAGSMSYASPSEATFQESRRGNINSTSAYVDAPGHVPQTTVPITPIRPPKGPAKVFEGIVDLDPGVTLFNTATGVVKSDISPQISLADSKSVERMLRIWNRKTSDDIEMKKLCEAEMRRLERK